MWNIVPIDIISESRVSAFVKAVRRLALYLRLTTFYLCVLTTPVNLLLLLRTYLN